MSRGRVNEAPTDRHRREARIRWRARRGTRELDILLARYLEARLGALDESGLVLLERLLDAQDPDLQAWLTGDGSPVDDALARLVDEIRSIPPAKPGR